MVSPSEAVVAGAGVVFLVRLFILVGGHIDETTRARANFATSHMKS